MTAAPEESLFKGGEDSHLQTDGISCHEKR